MVSTIPACLFIEPIEPWGLERLHSCKWLQMRAANGLSILYMAYLELDVILCEKIYFSMWDPGNDTPGAPSSASGILVNNVIYHC